MEIQFNSEQLHHFTHYEKVRKSGRWNMLDPKAQLVTGLSQEQYLFVLENYSELKAEVERKTS